MLLEQTVLLDLTVCWSLMDAKETVKLVWLDLTVQNGTDGVAGATGIQGK
jgi:hypothetical protein